MLDAMGSYRFAATVDAIPWRGLLFGLAAAAALFLFFPGGPPRLSALSVAVIAVPTFLQAYRRADFLTDTALVQRAGIFFPSYSVLPLAAIESLEVSYPRFGKSLRVGHLNIRAERQHITFVCIHDPEGVAALITRAKDRSTEDRGTAPA